VVYACVVRCMCGACVLALYVHTEAYVWMPDIHEHVRMDAVIYFLYIIFFFVNKRVWMPDMHEHVPMPEIPSRMCKHAAHKMCAVTYVHKMCGLICVNTSHMCGLICVNT
jgi:hypothetical protein